MEPTTVPPVGSRLDISKKRLLDAGIAVLSEKGLAGVTLRPLAQRLGVSVSAVTSRFGQKIAVLTTLCAAAMAEESALLAAWESRLGESTRLPAAVMADIVDAVLDDLAGAGSGFSYLHCEVLQEAAWQPELRPAVSAWLTMRADFWTRLAARADFDSPFDLGDALHALAIDEIVYGLALGRDNGYRWLRKLCVRRLCSGLLAGADAWEAQSFQAVFRELGADTPHGQRYQREPLSKVAAQAAPAIAALIIAGGSEAVTHRAVAARVGMPPTTLVHHFPRQIDLLRAGLDEIIGQLHADVDASVDLERVHAARGPNLAAATFAIALAAVRIPDLAPVAADMRRRRGENGLTRLRSMSESPERIDMLVAQTISVVAFGTTHARRALGGESALPIYDAFLELVRCGGKAK